MNWKTGNVLMIALALFCGAWVSKAVTHYQDTQIEWHCTVRLVDKYVDRLDAVWVTNEAELTRPDRDFVLISPLGKPQRVMRVDRRAVSACWKA